MRRALAALLAGLTLAGCNAPDYTPVRDWASSASLAADYRAPPLAADSILAMQEAVSLHLSMLSLIAGDGVIPYREQPFKQQLARLAPADEAARAPMTKLGEQLARSSRAMDLAPQMRDLVVATDPNLQALLEALYAAAGRQAKDAAPQDAAAIAQYRGVLAQIAEGHAMLKDRAPRIQTEEAAYYIRYAEQQLRLATTQLPRQGLLLPASAPRAE